MASSKHEGSDNQPNLNALIPLQEAAKLSGLSPSHLRLLVGKGEIWGIKPGRNWYTTEEAVREYLARDVRPGPKPKSQSESDKID